MKKSSQKEGESLVSMAIAVVEYVNSQRIFLIGKPSNEQFNQLICVDENGDFKALLVDKMKPNISKNTP